MANDPNLNSLFDNLNMISANEITQRRTGGGTGGGSQMFEGNMDPNPLIGLNPYLGENVTSFEHGGSMSSTGGGERWRYEQNRLPEPSVRTFAPPGIHPEVVRLEQKTREDQFFRDTPATRGSALGLDFPGPRRDNLYSSAYNAEASRRKAEGQRKSAEFWDPTGQRAKNDPTWSNRMEEWNLSQDNIKNFKHPWEQDYDNWYGQANKGMKMPKYRNGGVTHTMSDGTVHPGATHEEYMDMMNKYKHGGKYIKPMYSNGGVTRPQAYNQGGSYLQQANQSIQASQQANEQQALGQLSGLVAKSLQKKISPEQATAMASQMAEQSGLVNQPMANRGMRMRKRYTQGGRF
jgi:hypothetical protein